MMDTIRVLVKEGLKISTVNSKFIAYYMSQDTSNDDSDKYQHKNQGNYVVKPHTSKRL